MLFFNVKCCFFFYWTQSFAASVCQVQIASVINNTFSICCPLTTLPKIIPFYVLCRFDSKMDGSYTVHVIWNLSFLSYLVWAFYSDLDIVLGKADLSSSQ